MRVIGMMSGTSADGIDAALVRLEGAPPELKMIFEGHKHFEFRGPVREAILRLANGEPTTTAEISQLNFAVGGEFAQAVLTACEEWRLSLGKIDLIGSHGQTIYHQAEPTRCLGIASVNSTLQIGEPGVIAAQTGIPVVADFRPTDMAVGGQGAPLVPFVDYLLYRSKHVGRVALNIGGIANVTVIPANATHADVFAFDTGPGNMIIDALVEVITEGREHYDKDAQIAMAGKTIPGLLDRFMRDHYFQKKPPKTAGREQFGKATAERMLAWGKEHGAQSADLVRTATVLTAMTIANAFQRFILPRAHVREMIVAGGGTYNPLIMAQLAASLPGIEFIPSRELGGVPEDAKEAFAFAVLAYEAWHGRINNLPAATGALRPVIMGKIVRPFKRRRKTFER
ncbi:MAG TPA: anhydro-N-acetylmuramic acid kinase [Candidatus Aquilonibacter sp.]|nr:anhydro-N-acetylmuramic acid kinase [Candidatus Aquilonibacter sp.]